VPVKLTGAKDYLKFVSWIAVIAHALCNRDMFARFSANLIDSLPLHLFAAKCASKSRQGASHPSTTPFT